MLEASGVSEAFGIEVGVKGVPSGDTEGICTGGSAGELDATVPAPLEAGPVGLGGLGGAAPAVLLWELPGTVAGGLTVGVVLPLALPVLEPALVGADGLVTGTLGRLDEGLAVLFCPG